MYYIKIKYFIVKINPYNEKQILNKKDLSNNLFKIRKNIFFNQPEIKNRSLFGNLKEKNTQNPLSLIEEFQKKKQLEITKNGTISNKGSLKTLNPSFKRGGDPISLKRKELNDVLNIGLVKKNKNQPKKYEGSSFLSPSNNKIISELDVIKWRHNLKTNEKKNKK